MTIKYLNKKGFSLIEAMISVIILSILTISVLSTVQYMRTLEYVYASEINIRGIHEMILSDLELIKNNSVQASSIGSVDFSSNVKSEFLSVFPSAEPLGINDKKCYSIGGNSIGNGYLYKGSSDIVNLSDDEGINKFGNTQKATTKTEDAVAGSYYPTTVCISQGFKYFDEANSSKDTVSGPLLITIFSNYFGAKDIKTIQTESVIYFNDV